MQKLCTEFIDATGRSDGHPKRRHLDCNGGANRAGCTVVNERDVAVSHRTHLRLRPITDVVDPDDLLLLSVFSRYSRTAQQPEHWGSTAASLNSSCICARYEFELPPLPVQRRIAGILSAYDELIENNQRRIKILEAMARSLYREWFVHFRFPGHDKVKMVPSPLGPIPQGWEVVRIHRNCRRSERWHAPKRMSRILGRGHSVLHTSRCTCLLRCARYDKHVTEARSLPSVPAISMLRLTLVFITARGTVGKVALPSVPMAMNQSCSLYGEDRNFPARSLLNDASTSGLPQNQHGRRNH